MKYPTGDEYRILYARYFKRSPADLLKGVQVKGKRVLDLCGGNGRLSQWVIEQGCASCTMVEESPDMISAMRLHEKISVVQKSVSEFLRSNSNQYDLIVCQQAVNYWISDSLIKLLIARLAVGGQFVFNTFNTQPTTKPYVKQYEYEGHQFVEISWLVPDMIYKPTKSIGIHNFSTVHHVQIRDGLLPHATEFAWISPEQFMELLGDFEHVNRFVDGPTTIYICGCQS